MPKNVQENEESKCPLFQLFYIEDNEDDDVFIEEVEEINFPDVRKHLEHGESVFITLRKQAVLEPQADTRTLRKKRILGTERLRLSSGPDTMTIQNEIKGVILAGGEGKRLRPLSYYLQKCMIPIGESQKPLLEYTIQLLKYHEITDITMLVDYKHEQIMAYFGDGNRFGMNINYMQDNPLVKGTGSALLNFYRRGLLDPEGTLLIYYGDILSNIDLTEMLARHRNKDAVATLALSRGYNVPVGVAEVKGDVVASWAEKPDVDLCVGIGVVAIQARVLDELNRARIGKEFDIMKDLIPHLIARGDLVQAYITDSFWYDVGSLEKYEKLDNGTVEKQLSFLHGLYSPPIDLSSEYIAASEIEEIQEERNRIQTFKKSY